jgi:PiT family inorganic phosphate transporter
LAIVLSVVLGGNNFSTCLGASIGAGIVRLRDAMLIASVGVFLGVLLEGDKLSNVLNGGILPAVPTSSLVSILVSSLLVMTVVTLFHIPLSLSQVIVGAGWGIALATGVGLHVYSLLVLASWILSPVVAFAASAMTETIVVRLGRHVKGIMTLNRLYADLTLIAGFYAAYALGANTLGLLVGLFTPSLPDPFPLSLVLSASTAVGILFLSRGTVRSVADNLVGLSPSTAMSAQFGAAFSVHLFTELGLPVSVSQAVIGGMSGAASVKQIAIINKRIVRQIVVGWTVGPIAGAVISFLLTKAI